jgi:RNA polymerase sigma-70 factor (ECF subfamily)
LFDSFELSLPLPADSEEAEVRRARAKEPATWAAWYDRYFPAIFRYARARTGNREEAEDIASQVFLRALESIEHYKFRGRPILAWLYRIAHNLIADRARQKKRRLYVPLQSVETLAANDDRMIDRTELAEALDGLKRDQREVIVLRYLAAMNTREIACAMGKSESAIYSLQLRAIAALRKELRL